MKNKVYTYRGIIYFEENLINAFFMFKFQNEQFNTVEGDN